MPVSAVKVTCWLLIACAISATQGPRCADDLSSFRMGAWIIYVPNIHAECKKSSQNELVRYHPILTGRYTQIRVCTNMCVCFYRCMCLYTQGVLEVSSSVKEVLTTGFCILVSLPIFKVYSQSQPKGDSRNWGFLTLVPKSPEKN